MNWIKKTWIRFRPFKGPIILFRLKHRWYRPPCAFSTEIMKHQLPYVRTIVTLRGFVWSREDGWTSRMTQNEVIDLLRKASPRRID